MRSEEEILGSPEEWDRVCKQAIVIFGTEAAERIAFAKHRGETTPIPAWMWLEGALIEEVVGLEMSMIERKGWVRRMGVRVLKRVVGVLYPGYYNRARESRKTND